MPRCADDIRSTKAIRLGLRQVDRAQGGSCQPASSRGAARATTRCAISGCGPALPIADARKAGRGRCLRLARAQPARGALGGPGADGHATAPRRCRCSPAPGRAATGDEPDADLPPMPPGEAVVHDYRTLSLSLKGHPVQLPARRCSTGAASLRCADLVARAGRRIVEVAGLVLVRQRPGTASGRDLCHARGRDRHRQHHRSGPRSSRRTGEAVLGSRLMAVRGELQREGLVIHVIARELLRPDAAAARAGARPRHRRRRARRAATRRATAPTAATGGRDEAHAASARWPNGRRGRRCPGGRNFH